MIVIGQDLGQAADYTATSAIEINTEQVENDSRGNPQFDTYYDVRHLQRFELNTSYPDIVKVTTKMMKTPQLIDNCVLVPDATGVGRPVVDLYRGEKIHMTPVVITFSGDASVDMETGYWHVPKKELISNLQILFGNHRLRFANGLRDKDVVIKELMNFKVKITSKANDTYEAWREGDHDDLVLSIALACWWATKFKKEPKPREPWTSPLIGMKGL
jgi:hypothetical protein